MLPLRHTNLGRREAAVEVALRLQPFHYRQRLGDPVVLQIDEKGEGSRVYRNAVIDGGRRSGLHQRHCVDDRRRIQFDRFV